jgi:hypothetical protein
LTTRIGVLGNCDTGGIAYSLGAMLPRHRIAALIPPRETEERIAWFAGLGARHDLILVNNSVFKNDARHLLEPHMGQVRRYPTSHFSAFHPDCCYVGVKATNTLISPEYNSAICMAGFVRGLSQEQVVALFSRTVFEKLGYFDAWAPNVKHMQKEFSECGMDHRPYHLKVKRLGAFMHSFNHPKIETVVTLARFIALDLGAHSDVLDRPVDQADRLAAYDWPLYPEIGKFYGVRGVYMWKMDDKFLGLEDFVAKSFARYAELGLTAEGVFFGSSDFHERFAEILNERGIGNG